VTHSHSHTIRPLVHACVAENLDVSHNQFTGTVRDAFGMFKRLDFLDLGQNAFTGSIPSSLFDIPTIRLVYLSDNRFDEFIPSNLGDAENIRDLYLGGNRLEGQVPSILPGQLPNLNEFLVFDNNLTGEMPASICALRTPAGNLEDLWADCASDMGGDPQITCSCCTQCNNFVMVP
jgi:hypothetical protein